VSQIVDRSWRFAARDPEGRRLTGTVDAGSEAEAQQILIAQKLSPVSLEAIGGATARLQRLRSTVDTRALAIFTRQFATLVRGGLPLLTSIEMLRDLATDRILRMALRRVAQDINGGASLSDALRSHPHVFSPIYVHMVDAGEVGGTLPVALERVADYMETSKALRDRVVSALIYPGVVLAVAVLALGAILIFVVPVFAELFASEGLALPFATRVLLGASEVVLSFWYLLLLGAAALVVLFRGFVGSEAGRVWVDYLLLRLPLIGGLTRKTAVARFTRAMASMLHSGVTLSDVLWVSARVSGNVEIERAILDARDAIHAGSDLTTPIARAKVLPPLLAQMVKVGEESGQLDAMMDKVADFYEMEVRTAIDGAMKALEPAMIVLLGVMLGTVVVAMYTPIFDLMTSLG
jgi:type IV pilus assembly protein PilC